MGAVQVGVVKHIVAESVGSNRVVDIVVLIGVPVVRQLLGAKHQNGFVAVFVVFYNRKRSKGFAETDAVCKNTAVVFFQFIDNGKGCIALEIIEHSPDFAFLEAGCLIGENILRYIFQKFAENIVESHKVNEVRRILIIGSRDAVDHLTCDDLKHLAVVPDFIEVSKQSAGKGLVLYNCGADYIAFFATKFNRSKVVDGGITYAVNYNLSLNRFVTDI